MIKRILPHATAIAAMMTIIFFVISRFNTAMNFMDSNLSQWLFFILALLALWCAVMLIRAGIVKRIKKKYKEK